MARQFLLLAVLVPVARVEAIDPGRVVKGDTLRVAVAGATLHVKGKPAARLPGNAALRVLEIRERWVGGAVMIDGKESHGWLAVAKVYKPDDPADVAALARAGFRLEADFTRSIVEATAIRREISRDQLFRLKALCNLEALDLSATTIADDDLRQLRDLTNLRRLYLAKTAIGDRGLESLTGLPRLEVLALGETRITGSGLERFGKMPELEVLNLSACRIGDDDLATLARFGNLRVLALDATRVQGAGLRHLQQLPRLNLLNLNGCPLQDGLLSLRGLEDLRALYLDRAVLDIGMEGHLNRLLPRMAIIKGDSR